VSPIGEAEARQYLGKASEAGRQDFFQGLLREALEGYPLPLPARAEGVEVQQSRQEMG